MSEETVHIWTIPLNPSDLSALDSQSLGLEERARLDRFHFARDRRRYLVSHLAMRTILAGYLNCDVREIAYAVGPYGRPALTGMHAADPLYFNLSHAHELALLAVGRASDLGVDVEHVRPLPDWLEVARRFFSPDEVSMLQSIEDEASRMEGFFRIWTRKEALLKALGVGMSLPSTRFSVLSAPAIVDVAAVVASASEQLAVHDLTSLSPKDEYVGAVATSALKPNVLYIQERRAE